MKVVQESKMTDYEKLSQLSDSIFEKYNKHDTNSIEYEFLAIYPFIYRHLSGINKLTHREIISEYELDLTPEKLGNLIHKIKNKKILKNYTGLIVLTTKNEIPAYILNKSYKTEYGFSVLFNNDYNSKYAIEPNELSNIESAIGKLYIKKIMYWWHISDLVILKDVANKGRDILIKQANDDYLTFYNSNYDKMLTDPKYL